MKHVIPLFCMLYDPYCQHNHFVFFKHCIVLLFQPVKLSADTQVKCMADFCLEVLRLVLCLVGNFTTLLYCTFYLLKLLLNSIPD
jgi:hypothetical protein